VPTARSDDDAAALFVADPLLVHHEASWFLFVEIDLPEIAGGVLAHRDLTESEASPG
jgi:hypothetical protein